MRVSKKRMTKKPMKMKTKMEMEAARRERKR